LGRLRNADRFKLNNPLSEIVVAVVSRDDPHHVVRQEFAPLQRQKHSVFQVHGVDAAGQVVTRRQLKRRYVLAFFQKLPSCLVGIEACASSHYWSRELQTLGAQRAVDAASLCEALRQAAEERYGRRGSNL
jgi:hypothetical protein